MISVYYIIYAFMPTLFILLYYSYLVFDKNFSMGGSILCTPMYVFKYICYVKQNVNVKS